MHNSFSYTSYAKLTRCSRFHATISPLKRRIRYLHLCVYQFGEAWKLSPRCRALFLGAVLGGEAAPPQAYRNPDDLNESRAIRSRCFPPQKICVQYSRIINRSYGCFDDFAHKYLSGKFVFWIFNSHE